jgi:hypothetical protein
MSLNSMSEKKQTVKKIKISESSKIAAFITAISSKNYAQAHKYLTAVVNNKLQARISKAANDPLF